MSRGRWGSAYLGSRDYIDSQIEVDWTISGEDLKYYCLLVGGCSFALGVIIGASLILTYMVR